MPLSLNLIIGSIVSLIAAVVAVTCVTITLVFFSSEIDNVGRAWASGMNNGVFEKMKTYMADKEASLLTVSNFAQTYAPMLPSDLHAQGLNFTQLFTPYMQSFMRKLDFNYVSHSIIWTDNWWMYSAVSTYIGYPAFIIEWVEFFNATGDGTFGGVRFWKDNGTLIPYDASTNYQPEGAAFVFTKPLTAPSFAQLVQYVDYVVKPSMPDKSKPFCLWTEVDFGYYPEKNQFFEQFGVCVFSNKSGYTLGYNTLSLAVDNQLAQLISDSPRSKNGQIFIIDNIGFLLSVTTSDPYFTIRDGTLSETLAAGCKNTAAQPHLVPAKIGCRFHYTKYTYAPLAALPQTFVLSTTPVETVLTIDGKDYIIFNKRFSTEVGGLGYNVISVTPRDDMMNGVDEGRNMAIGIAAGLLVVGILIAVIIVYFTLLPLTDLAEKMEKTARLEGLDKDEEIGGDDESSNGGAGGAQLVYNNNASTAASATISLASASMIKEIANLEVAYAFSHNQLVNFTRYVPKNVVKEVLIKGAENMDKMTPTHVTVSTLDIAGFSSIVEKMRDNDDALSTLLHAFFKRMTRLVMAHGGIVDRFVGDCVVSIWGAPFKVDRHELLGALCALAFQRETMKNPLKKIFEDLKIPLGIRVGVAAGQVLAGNIGSRNRKAYTVLGDTVATSDKLEAYNKHWGTVVMVSEEVARECNDELVLRLLTRIKLAGRAKPVMAYHAMGVIADAKLKKRNGKSVNGSGGDAGSSSDGSSDMSSPTTGQSDSNSFMSSQSKSMSLSDLMSAASLGSGASGDLLPANVKLDKLLYWHKKRTACDEATVNFANEFNEAARSVIDHDFASALKKLNALETDNWVSEKWKTHKSVGILKDLIKKAMVDGPSLSGSPNTSFDLNNKKDFYVEVA